MGRESTEGRVSPDIASLLRTLKRRVNFSPSFGAFGKCEIFGIESAGAPKTVRSSAYRPEVTHLGLAR